MAYVSSTDLAERFGDQALLRLAPDGAGGLDADMIARACDDASGEADGYISAAGIDVPMMSAPAVVIARVCDIAWYRLHVGNIPEPVEARYKAANRFFEGVSTGKVSLGQAAPEDTLGEVVLESRDHVMPGGSF
jgi:phage gp36-like protein